MQNDRLFEKCLPDFPSATILELMKRTTLYYYTAIISFLICGLKEIKSTTETTKGSRENSDSHWLHCLRHFSNLNWNWQQIWNQGHGLQILVIFGHLLPVSGNKEFQFQDTGQHVNFGKLQLVCQTFVILLYKLDTVSWINTCHNPFTHSFAAPQLLLTSPNLKWYFKIKYLKLAGDIFKISLPLFQ